MRRVHLFDLSEPADPRLVTEMWIDEVEKVALGRRATRAVSRHRGLEGRPATRDRFYLHTYGNRYSDGWPTHHVFQTVDVTDLSEPVWLGRWSMIYVYPYFVVERLEAIGDVGVFAGSTGGEWAPCDTRIATWIAESESIRPVEWRLTGGAVVAMETHERSLLIANLCRPYTVCDNWLSAYEISSEGRLVDVPGSRCKGPARYFTLVAKPSGVFYTTDSFGSEWRYRLEALVLDSERGIVPAHAPSGLLHDECGSVVVPIRGALVAACSYDNSLRIQPTEYALPPFLLGEWVERGTEEIFDDL